MTVTRADSASNATENGVESISSRKLLGNRKRLSIEHNGEQYTLRVTSNNKLILTK